MVKGARALARIGTVVALTALVSACGSPAPRPSLRAEATPSPPALTLSVDNRTTITVTLVVNGSAIRYVSPGALEDPITASLPDLPWTVELRSPSGRILTGMKVKPGDTTDALTGTGRTMTGDVARVHLPCGFLAVWAGPQLESPWATGPGDCS
jgi:hypothetical protein